MNRIAFALMLSIALFSCKKDDPIPPDDDPTTQTGPQLIFRFAFDDTQERLDNFGNPTTIPIGHAGQSPQFNAISAHYLELTEDMWTQLGAGEVLYQGPETDAGGTTAIDFDQAKVVAEGENFVSYNLADISPGTYEWLRVSLSYQNYDIEYLSAFGQFTGTLASFIGYNNYITDYTIDEETIVVNDDKLQGYWGFETLGITATGSVPEGGITVPNPIQSTSPIPAGSCLVTGDFEQPLEITGNETEDIIVTISLSNNQSFEWIEVNEDGLYEPEAGEIVVDMGIRGLIPSYE